jgi:hypothetical protein
MGKLTKILDEKYAIKPLEELDGLNDIEKSIVQLHNVTVALSSMLSKVSESVLLLAKEGKFNEQSIRNLSDRVEELELGNF